METSHTDSPSPFFPSIITFTSTHKLQHTPFRTKHRGQEKKQTSSVYAPADMFAHLGSTIGGLMFVWAIFQQYFPYQLRSHIEKYSQRLVGYVYPYIQITFNEFTGERLMRSEAYSAIENYLSSKSSTQAKRLRGDIKNNQSLVLSMDDHEEVADQLKGVQVWWASGKENISKSQTFSYIPINDEKRYYKLAFYKRKRDLIIGPYLAHVLKEGNAKKVRNRQRKLYTNNGSHFVESELVIPSLIIYHNNWAFFKLHPNNLSSHLPTF